MDRLTFRSFDGSAHAKQIGFYSILDKLAEYKDAEEQGLLQTIECHCKDCIHWSDKVAGATEHVKLCTVGGYMVGKNGYCVYAEQALEEMKGEK